MSLVEIRSNDVPLLFRNLTISFIISLLSLLQISVAEDRHSGYYYPKPLTIENYAPRAPKFPESTEYSRIAFVTALTKQAMHNPYAPEFVFFSKGEWSEKAIITAIGEGRYNTIYRMRALMAMMTALARGTPMFQQSATGSKLTFLDMLFMMGFTQITISDGKTVSHQIIFK